MDIVDMAIPQVVCQKFGFHGNSDFQKFSKARPFTNKSKKKFSPKYASCSKIFWCKKWTHGTLKK
jgi:hypothetical protein